MDVIENGQRRTGWTGRIALGALVLAVLVVLTVRLIGSRDADPVSNRHGQPSLAPTSASTAAPVLQFRDDQFTKFDNGAFLIQFKLVNYTGRSVSATVEPLPDIPGIRDDVARLLPSTDWSIPDSAILNSPATPITIKAGESVVYAIGGYVTCGRKAEIDSDYPAKLSVDNTAITLQFPPLNGDAWAPAVEKGACAPRRKAH